MLKAYLKYRKARVNAHGIHSPFVFEFYNEIIKKHKAGIDPDIEALRTALLKSKKKIRFDELGAGSKKENQAERAVSSIAKHAATNSKFGGLLARLCHFYNVDKVLEVGASLGIGTAYLAKHTNEIVTLEGCSEVLELAKENFKTLGYNQIETRLGEFTKSLAELKQENKIFDLIYIDGNHQLEPTLAYFEFAMNNSHDDTFIILDDIYWSPEMEMAWEKIKADERINVSIDLFRLGIVCKRPTQRKQDFVVKF
ncbi:MAG: SAM-dependent methyltransferase [Crocinitomix sp.]|nr:SAM-dependent methyltransferase [Crocinitomix sp.]